jgi:hypothetical protein
LAVRTVRLLRLTVTRSLGESLYAQVGTSDYCPVAVDWVFGCDGVAGTSVSLCAPITVMIRVLRAANNLSRRLLFP